MGMFDTTKINCPTCGHANEIQSKGGDCVLAEYPSLEETPHDVLGGLLTVDDLITCAECGEKYRLQAEFSAVSANIAAEFIMWVEAKDDWLKLDKQAVNDVYQFITNHSLFPVPSFAKNKAEAIVLTWKNPNSNITLEAIFSGYGVYEAELTLYNEVIARGDKAADQPLPDDIFVRLPFVTHLSIHDQYIENRLGESLASGSIVTLNLHSDKILLSNLLLTIGNIYEVWNSEYIQAHLYMIYADAVYDAQATITEVK